MPKPGQLNGCQAEIGEHRPPMAHADTQPKNHIRGDGFDRVRQIIEIASSAFAFESMHLIIKRAHMTISLRFFGHQHQAETLAQLAQILPKIAILHVIGMHDLGRDQQGRARLQRPDLGQRRIAEADTLSPLA